MMHPLRTKSLMAYLPAYDYNHLQDSITNNNGHNNVLQELLEKRTAPPQMIAPMNRILAAKNNEFTLLTFQGVNSLKKSYIFTLSNIQFMRLSEKINNFIDTRVLVYLDEIFNKSFTMILVYLLHVSILSPFTTTYIGFQAVMTEEI
ncbi:hypothetical protein ACJX0J_029677 [Zea mays]